MYCQHCKEKDSVISALRYANDSLREVITKLVTDTVELEHKYAELEKTVSGISENLTLLAATVLDQTFEQAGFTEGGV
jgi:SMC interacting uncharacterized protein involved in chromosome segregation